MSISSIISLIMAIFFVAGAIDRLFGCRIGIGKEFERGFMLIGTTGLAVLGLMALAPVLADVIKDTVAPVFEAFGANASSLPGALLSCDIGYPIAEELAGDARIGQFNGLIVGSVSGFIVSFTIPVACGLINKEDYRYFSVGILSGCIFDPLASFIGGLLMGIEPVKLLLNLIPVIAIAVVIAIGLLLAPVVTINVFKWFSRLILLIVTVGLICAAFEAMTGITVIQGMNPISDGFKTVGLIGLSLAGALPFLWTLQKLFGKQLNKLGAMLGMNDTSILCTILGFSSLIPGYTDYAKMNSKGKVIFSAFSASAGCMLGAHLGFTSAVCQDVVAPMLVSKILAGIFAVITAAFFYPRLIKE